VRAVGGDPLEQDRRWPRRRPHQRGWPSCLGPSHLLGRRALPGQRPGWGKRRRVRGRADRRGDRRHRFRIRRRVRAEDPADLGAQLSYVVEVLAADEDQDLDPAAAALSKSRQWVLTALRAGGDMQTVKQLGDRLAQAGHPLKPRTIQTALAELEAAGLAAGSEEGNGRARYWSPASPDDGAGGGAGTPGPVP
jgi:hypothetical protein